MPQTIERGVSCPVLFTFGIRGLELTAKIVRRTTLEVTAPFKFPKPMTIATVTARL